MSKLTLNGVVLECVQGDITRQADMDAVVNAANARLEIGGGVAGAIHRAAGPGLAEECRPLAPIAPGQAVITGAHGLPNRSVIHCLGPVYRIDEPSERLLASCYQEALRLAEQAGLRSVAFPALSTGAFGYPIQEATPVALAAVSGMASTLRSVDHIRFVLHSERDLQVYEAELARIRTE